MNRSDNSTAHKEATRTQFSSRNAATSIVGQVLSNLLRFVCRTVFIHTLGKDYLGINSLYSNVLTLLSVAELGFGSAITYSLYKPLVDNDRDSICALMNYYRKAYQIIGVVILAAGLVVMPFLPWLMTGVTDKVNIYEYYLLYLLQTVVSYLFFAYKSTLILADQKKYVYDLVQYAIQIIMMVIQIIVLVVWGSFFVYTVLGIVQNIVFNMIMAWIVDRRYPYLHGSRAKNARLSAQGRKDIRTRVYAMSLYKICNSVGSATDNLIISSMIGTVVVGLYNNYYSIINIFQTLLGQVFRSFSASLGNLYAQEGRKKSEFVFHSLNLCNNMLVSVFSVCFLVLFQPFVTFWIGEDYLLSNTVLFIVVMNFATNYLQNMVQIDREVTGVFVKGKYRAVATTVINLVVSIILVKAMGLGGVFLGSIIARMLTTGLYDPWLLYHDGFGMSPAGFYRDFCVSIGIICGCGWLIETFVTAIGSTAALGAVGNLIVRALLGLTVPALCFWLIYGRTRYARYMQGKLKDVLRKRKKR